MSVRPFWYAFGNLGSNIFSQAFATFALFFYIDHLHAPLGAITAALAVQSVWHALLNPAIGQISDRTRTRFGRRIPYIAVLTLPLGLIFFLLWDPLVGHAWLWEYFFVVVMLFDLIYLAVVLNWTSLFPEMFRTISQRSRAQSPRQIIGVVALVIGVAVPPILYGHLGWTAMGLILAVIGTVGLFLSLFGSKESTPPPPRTPWSFWESWHLLRGFQGFRQFLAMNFLVQLTLGLIPAILPFYAKYVLHISDTMLSVLLGTIFLTAMVLIIPWTHITRRIGSHRALNWTIVCLAIGVIPFSWSSSLSIIIPSAVVLGAGLAGFLTLADVLMAEVIDHDAGGAKPRREGIFYGVNGFILRLGVSIQALLLYIVLHFTGYYANSAGHATITVQDGFRALISVIPLAFLIGAFFVIQHFTVPESSAQPSAPQES